MAERLLRLDDVKDRTSLPQSTIYALMCKGEFPKNVKRGKTALWLESEIDGYIRSLVEQRDNQTPSTQSAQLCIISARSGK